MPLFLYEPTSSGIFLRTGFIGTSVGDASFCFLKDLQEGLLHLPYSVKSPQAEQNNNRFVPPENLDWNQICKIFQVFSATTSIFCLKDVWRERWSVSDMVRPP